MSAGENFEDQINAVLREIRGTLLNERLSPVYVAGLCRWVATALTAEPLGLQVIENKIFSVHSQ